METKYNEVHVVKGGHSDNIEIKPEYVYLTIPAEYVCVYHKLLVYMADFGKTIVDDCNAICKGNSKNIITCWNLFQSAIACKELGRDKEAEFFINYIKSQLNNIYKGSDKSVFNDSIPVSVSEDGRLKAMLSCGNETHFTVDAETGRLYEDYKSENDTKVYVVDGDNLKVSD